MDKIRITLRRVRVGRTVGKEAVEGGLGVEGKVGRVEQMTSSPRPWLKQYSSFRPKEPSVTETKNNATAGKMIKLS